MVKTILLLLLCVPLGWIGWREGQNLFRAGTLRVPELDAVDDHDRVKTMQTEAEAILKEFEPVKTLVICLDDPAVAPSSAQEPRLPVRKLLEYGQVRRKAGEQVKKERDEAEWRKKLLTELMTTLCPHGQPRLDLPGKLKTLEQRTEEYRKGPLRDEQHGRSARLLVDWIKLEGAHPEPELTAFYQTLDRWNPGDLPPVAGGPESHAAAKAYRGFLEKPEARAANAPQAADSWAQKADELVREARKRASHWEFGLTLAELLPRNMGAVPWERQADQIRAIVELADRADALAAERLPSARGAYRKLSEALIPTEPLDEQVTLLNDPQGHPRATIQVTLEGEGTPRPLSDVDGSGLDEFALKARPVKDITVDRKSLDGHGTSPIQPTKYSEAIHAFNRERSGVRTWNESDVSRLLRVCQDHRQNLERGGGKNAGGKDLIPRLERLLKIVQGHPKLFASTP
jgi:hypothetical protein